MVNLRGVLVSAVVAAAAGWQSESLYSFFSNHHQLQTVEIPLMITPIC
jgi:hypothetical protein